MSLKSNHLAGTSLKSLILKQLYYEKALSCAEMSELFNKSIPLIAKAVNELITGGFVIERGLAPSSGGRRPLKYALRADAFYILSIAMDRLSTTINLLDLNNTPVAESKTAELILLNSEKALPQLVRLIDQYIVDTGISKDKIAGIGIGMPGFVNVKEGINYTYLKTEGQSLTGYLTEHTSLPVYIDNDSSLIALAEQKFGVARLKEDVMVINLSWGIGLGMIINGQIYRGNNGFAGELSHIPLSDDGALCTCGKRGCLEVEASLLQVTEKAIQGINEHRVTRLKNQGRRIELIAEDLMQVAIEGDQFAIELFTEAGRKIGKALAILIHIMNPSAIVLSGRGTKIAPLLISPIQQAFNQYCIPRLKAYTEVLISNIGLESEMIGAAALVIENMGNYTKALSPDKEQVKTESTIKTL